jgi:hypothetical protein
MQDLWGLRPGTLQVASGVRRVTVLQRWASPTRTTKVQGTGVMSMHHHHHIASNHADGRQVCARLGVMVSMHAIASKRLPDSCRVESVVCCDFPCEITECAWSRKLRLLVDVDASTQ